MLILTTTLFGPQFSFRQHFEQSNCILPRFLYDTVRDDIFQVVACFFQTSNNFIHFWGTSNSFIPIWIIYNHFI